MISSISSNNGDVNLLSEASNNVISDNTGSLHSVLKEEEITNKFREYLLYGSGKEALGTFRFILLHRQNNYQYLR